MSSPWKTQWADSDNDGYGDNQTGANPDMCPTIQGFSQYDRMGCPEWTKMATPILHQIGPRLTEQMHSPQSTLSGRSDSDGFGDNPHLPTLQTTAQTKRVPASKTSPDVAILMQMAGQMREMRSFTSPVNGPTATLTDTDNPYSTYLPDYCPNLWGNSSMSLLGCPDLDGDGWSDIEDSHPMNSLLWSD